MTKWILGALAVAALVGPATAAAEPFTPELEADYASALAWWGVSSPPQCSSVTLEMQATDPTGEDATARATQPQPGEENLACAITVYEDRWAEESTCMKKMVIRHEVGHTLGLGHSEDPASIMAPSLGPSWCLLPELARIQGRCRSLSAQHAAPERLRLCWAFARQARRAWLPNGT